MTTFYLTMEHTKGRLTRLNWLTRSNFIHLMWWYYLTNCCRSGRLPGECHPTSWTDTEINLIVNGRIALNQPQMISWDGLKASYTLSKIRESVGFVCHELWVLTLPMTLSYERTFVPVSEVLAKKYTPWECYRGQWRNLNLSELRVVIQLIQQRRSGEDYVDGSWGHQRGGQKLRLSGS